jgi:dipeptidyl aminopeptidase/acylaminoacyl peptidase
MYQALKLLGKEVDFIQVKDQNHLIQNYNKRILWNNTIFAYFAKWLKDQPQWWNELYPDKNL